MIFFKKTNVNVQSLMVRWQPPPADAQNGEIIDYKIRYKKGTRKSEPLEITTGNQLSKLIDGKRFHSCRVPVF